ncbi:hypothetical protein SARC_07965 [Sphaeroforma arctica JP610]|uniref:Uncharacterized protein n=1 Tax=Sphaeroforma arctica JP610 TaxID=667725 RepID=A0A0L0FSC7_9EUKA|nr:hypothetical protein SARC_07965 [Sphaeroforma arctica JP610]KNC79645.1 hypothetical protein SARC_07965 [Sphaeroforma arctica JP610]|eukprot:XP_014153547.1 hypothetical protein SARC_07965 [Sphaeroforma arctica JP610]
MSTITPTSQVLRAADVDAVDGFVSTGEQIWLVVGTLPYQTHLLIGYDTQSSLRWEGAFDMEGKLLIIPGMDPWRRGACGVHCRHSNRRYTPSTAHKKKARGGTKQCKRKSLRMQADTFREGHALRPQLTWCGAAVPIHLGRAQRSPTNATQEAQMEDPELPPVSEARAAAGSTETLQPQSPRKARHYSDDVRDIKDTQALYESYRIRHKDPTPVRSRFAHAQPIK